ncbi:MAG TPA: hypothetical protein DD789_04545 [Firmicutes bacterium]|nr:hypothetical protein [Bacillota bacterium]
MKKIALIILVIMFIVGNLPSMVVAAKGGSVGAQASASSGWKNTGGSKDSGGTTKSAEKTDKSAQQRKQQEQQRKREQLQNCIEALEKEMAAAEVTSRFRNRLMTELRTRLEDELNVAEQGDGAASRAETQTIARLAERGEDQQFSPEETAAICTAFQGAVWAGIPHHLGEALADEGMRRRAPAAQIENTLRLTTRLCGEFRCQLLTKASEDNEEEALATLGRRLAEACREEGCEERLRLTLRTGCSLEEAVNQL